jgi:DNA-directed RNA polymerase beta' subunit
VIVPTVDLGVTEIGIPEEMAWALFGPQIAARVGAAAVEKRSEAAQESLREKTTRTWILMNRAPTVGETNLVALRPFIVPHRAIELHPSICRWINGDFDGDQVAVIAPITAGAEKDLEERVTVEAHLRRDPALLVGLLPNHEALWGLSRLAGSSEGRRELGSILEGRLPEGPLDADALAGAVMPFLEEKGAAETLRVVEALTDLGLAEAARSGASMNPFMTVETSKSAAHVAEDLASSVDYAHPGWGPQLRAIKTGARGSIENLLWMTHSEILTAETAEETLSIDHGKLDGLSAEELLPQALMVRERFQAIFRNLDEVAADYNQTNAPSGYGMMARAFRAEDPGVVFASAAATGEKDPLSDVDSRLFVGLSVSSGDTE